MNINLKKLQTIRKIHVINMLNLEMKIKKAAEV